MNISVIASAVSGRYVPVGEHHGFIESSLTIPGDGTVLGAYLFDCGNGEVRLTDDGDTLFNVAAAGAAANRSTASEYRDIATEYGVMLTKEGELTANCAEASASAVLLRFFEAAHRIAISSLAHRPRAFSNFTRVTDEVLTRNMPIRVTR